LRKNSIHKTFLMMMADVSLAAMIYFLFILIRRTSQVPNPAAMPSVG